MTSMDMVKEQFASIDEKLSKIEPGSKEYEAAVKAWAIAHQAVLEEVKAQTDVDFKNQELMKPIWKRPEFIIAVLQAVVTVGSMGMMLNFEKTGNITSKALGFIPKSIKTVFVKK